jgi:hypothetical protein
VSRRLVELTYDDVVGNRNLEREARMARAAYVGALHRLAQAMAAFSDARVRDLARPASRPYA